ncbi:MAG: hypothetical protein OXE74_05950 [Cyanobacteria bacterium MAG CAR2_bin_4]|nr:hypothetical protein [Cyanobacteria bacterium MAG CAR2_bin_4]
MTDKELRQLEASFQEGTKIHKVFWYSRISNGTVESVTVAMWEAPRSLAVPGYKGYNEEQVPVTD